MPKRYVVNGGRNLEGRVRVRGAKNAVTKQMVAALLASGTSKLENVPDIGDVDITATILRSLGCRIDHDRERGSLSISTAGLKTPDVDHRYSGLNRIPILLAGVLLSRFGKASIPMMGGCNIGSRPVDFHIQGLRAMGAEVEYSDGAYRFLAPRLRGAQIDLPFPSVGATENVMMASVLAEGTTVIRNAAIEPEIVDLALFLQSMGAVISQDVHRTWVIEGVRDLSAAQHTVINDRIEAASFAASAIATRGDVFIEGADQLHLQTFLNWLRKAGGRYEVLPGGIRFFGRDCKLESIAVETDVHPGLMTDWQQPLLILLTQADGVSVIHETVYEDRFGYVESLNHMGAKIQLFRDCLGGKTCRFRHSGHLHSAVVSGPTRLTGAEIQIPDLRAGFSYLVAAVLADGQSVLGNVGYIERGYDRVVSKFRDLGAPIQVEEYA